MMNENLTTLEREFIEIAMSEEMEGEVTLHDIQEYMDYLDENFMEGALEEYNEQLIKHVH
ncbi:MAG: hypothetical protein BM485_14350 [Desulfobulbaceae bacterium DB1]|nr:MAG: hypothetical protein BM485_14350 [Desulfobulbaceae bacterium DB1]